MSQEISDITVENFANATIMRSDISEFDIIRSRNNQYIGLESNILPEFDSTLIIGDENNRFKSINTNNITANALKPEDLQTLTFFGNLYPSIDDAYNIGVPTQRWKQLHVDDANANNLTANTLKPQDNKTITFFGNLFPSVDDQYYIGIQDQRWKRIVTTDISVSGNATLSGPTDLIDANTFIIDDTDSTKRFQFQADQITTGTTRTFTVPNADTTLVGTDVTQTLTNKNITGNTNTVRATQLGTTGSDVIVNSSSPPTTGQVLTATGPAAATWQSPTSFVSAINVQEEGANITGTPHSILNFIGNNITATDAGGGRANVTVSMPTTTKGDLMVHNGTLDVRQAVGTNDFLLTADSTASTGVSWKAPIFKDSLFRLVDSVDVTKQIAFDAAGTTGTTTTLVSSQTTNKTITFPDFTTTLVGNNSTQTLTNKSLIDASTFIVDDLDITKRFQFQASTITTGTTRTFTVPDADTTLVGTDVTQTLTNKTITGTTNTVAAKSLLSATTNVDVFSAAAPTSGQVLTAISGTSATWQSPTSFVSAINVREEGANITGTPHSTLNFVGNKITATNAGGGIANVTVSMPTTTKGDLMVHNGTLDVRQAVGTNDFLLTADSASSTGVSWKAPVFKDSIFRVVDAVDLTKQIAFDAAGTTGTTTTILSSQTTNKTITLPDFTTTLVGNNSTQTLTNKSLVDASTFIIDDIDITKRFQFQASTITTGTTRIFTVPNANTTLVGTDVAQTLTNKTITGTTNTVASKSLLSATTNVDVFAAAAPTAGQVLRATSGTAATWQTTSSFASAVNVQEEGVNITGTPHSTLNFIGNKITATNAGGGVSNITVAMPTTTKGDFMVHDGTLDVRQAVGTNDFLLTADSVSSTGVSWKAPVFQDSIFRVVDAVDVTKQIAFDAAGTTGTITTVVSSQTTNRTITLPDFTTTLVGNNSTQTLTNKSLVDASTCIVDDVDITKKFQFQASSITTGTTRTFTVPNADTTLVGTDVTQTLTNKTIIGTTNTVRATQLGTTGADVIINTASPPSVGQVLTATGATAATWQSGGGGGSTIILKNQGTNVTGTPHSAINFVTNSGITLTGSNFSGGTANVFVVMPTTTKGDLIVYNNTNLNSRLPIGTTDFLLTANSSDATFGMNWAAPVFKDSIFRVVDSVDVTKQIAFDAAGTTGTTTTLLSSQTANRTLTIPDATTVIVGTDVTQTLTNKTMIGTTNTVAAKSLLSATTNVDVFAAAAPTAGQVLRATSGTAATWQTTTSFASAVNVQEEGVNVTGTPHSTLNFIGNKITATNAGGGISNITVAMPTTTKGDLMVHNGTLDVRQAIGTNDFLLTADSVSSTGVSWKAPVFKDSLFRVVDAVDVTKQIAFDAAGTTGTTTMLVSSQTTNKTITLPDFTTTLVGDNSTQTLTNKSLVDASTFIIDDLDITKRFQFQASSITTGTTRTFTVPNADTTLVGTDVVQTLTNKTITGTTNTVRATQLGTTGADVIVNASAPPTVNQILAATSGTNAIWQNPGAVIGGSAITDNQYISATALDTTVSTVFNNINSMSLTAVVSGSPSPYLFLFNATCYGSNNNTTIDFSFAVNGTAVTGTVIRVTPETKERNVTVFYTTTGIANGDVITAQWRIQNGAIGNLTFRSMSILGFGTP